MVGDGATSYGLQLAAAVFTGKYPSRASLEKTKAITKGSLADLIFSMATMELRILSSPRPPSAVHHPAEVAVLKGRSLH